MLEYLLCSAIYFNDSKQHVHQPKNITEGFVICGRRHHNCYGTLHALGLERSVLKHEKTQGFLTNTDRFVDRHEAMRIAIISGQCKPSSEAKANDALFSEDLY